jgi:hypothetical protein
MSETAAIFAVGEMPDMRGLVVIFAALWVLGIAGATLLVFNGYLTLTARPVNRLVLLADFTASLGLAAILFGLGSMLDANAPCDKNWWCIGGSAAVLAAATAGCGRALGARLRPDRRWLLWTVALAADVLLLAAFWQLAKRLFGPWDG